MDIYVNKSAVKDVHDTYIPFELNVRSQMKVESAR